MSGRPVEPIAVVDLVEEYVYREISDAAKYDNRTPMDESGIFSLHMLAAEIYAAGFEDGALVAMRRADRETSRKRKEAQ